MFSRINLYDAALEGMLFIGLTFALQLWFVKGTSRPANRFLALALSVMAFRIAGILATDIKLWMLPQQFSLVLGPLIYFYVRKAIWPTRQFHWKDLLHFYPVLLGLAVWLSGLDSVLNPLTFMSIGIYLYLSHRQIKRFYSGQKFKEGDRYRYEWRWLDHQLSGLGLILLLGIPLTAIDYFGFHFALDRQSYYPLNLLFGLMVIRMGVVVFFRPGIDASADVPLFPKSYTSTALKQKGNWLKKKIEAGQLYQDPDLSVSTLAEQLGTPAHELSRIINAGLKKTFSDLINEYRIRDVVAKMQDPAYDHITLLGIAYESGFNSKTTFNRTFKQMTGKSPAEYKNELKKERPFSKMERFQRNRPVVLHHESTFKWSREKINRISMFRNYLKIAWRNIRRNKVYTGINVLGLSLGVCACLIIYLITRFELSYDSFHPDGDRIYRIVTSMQDGQGNKRDMAFNISILPVTLRNELSGFEDVTGFYNYFAKVTIPSANSTTRKFVGEESSPIIVTEPQYFKIFQYKWLQGDPSTALNEPFKVVLSKQEAYKYFGSESLKNVVGKQVIYDDSLRLTVSGIVEDWNKNTDFGFKDFISFATVQHSFLKKNIDLQSWSMWNFYSQGYVKLAKGVAPAAIEKQFTQFVKAHIRMEPGSKVKLLLQPLSDIHFNNHYEDSYSRQAHLPTLYGLMAIAVFILIIAAINFINLSTAQSLHRAKEVGVRKLLGSSETSLTVQFLIETFIVTAAALIVAVAVTNPIISTFHSFIPAGVALNLLCLPVLGFLVGILIVTSLLAGFYPARILSSYLPVLSLKGQGSEKLNRKSYLRKTLIVFQFTVSLIFIIGTLVVARQIHFVLNKDMGFNKDAVITIHTEGVNNHLDWNNPIDQLDVFYNKVKEIPNVQMLTRHHETPAAQRHGGTFIEYKGTGGAKIDASFDFCDENYVPLFDLKIIAGRNLSHSDTLKEYLVNETCSKALGFRKPEDAVGKLVEIGMSNSKRQIVGVVKDFNSQSLHEAITPFFMGSIKKRERTISIKLGRDINNFKTTITQIEKVWKTLYPNNEFEYTFFDQTIAEFYDKEQKTVQLMNTAMAIAIFISCMGLFGLATFTAQQRIKEIGIRKVLGASATSIVSMLTKDFLILIIISLVIASPIAYYLMHKWLQDFAYRIEINLWVFLISGLTAILIAFATVSFQAIKAALTNPVKSLRSE